MVRRFNSSGQYYYLGEKTLIKGHYCYESVTSYLMSHDANLKQ